MGKVICVVPARFGSTRFEGKPLADICGKSLIQRVYEQVKKAKLIDEIYIATDDERIKNKAESFGARVIMTSKHHPSGTDRVAEVAQKVDGEIIVNVQGDLPLVDPVAIDAVVKPLLENSDLVMATLITPIVEKEEYHNPNITKIVKDKNNFALYCSRSLIPWSEEGDQTTIFKHLGVYAYRKDFLIAFSKMKQTPCEKAEKLELLRALENGYKIKLVEAPCSPASMAEVDVPEDIAKIEKILKEKKYSSG
jgi:3-deoxy-manno-octulosonate cytidylyltransferase (CMP-KDO synthetase)